MQPRLGRLLVAREQKADIARLATPRFRTQDGRGEIGECLRDGHAADGRLAGEEHAVARTTPPMEGV